MEADKAKFGIDLVLRIVGSLAALASVYVALYSDIRVLERRVSSLESELAESKQDRKELRLVLDTQVKEMKTEMKEVQLNVREIRIMIERHYSR